MQKYLTFFQQKIWTDLILCILEENCEKKFITFFSAKNLITFDFVYTRILKEYLTNGFIKQMMH